MAASCINCGEAHDGGFLSGWEGHINEGAVGPFCSQCWEFLRETFIPPTECHDYSPPWFTGRWRDWHRGHGCRLDDGKPRSDEAIAEIQAHDSATAADAVDPSAPDPGTPSTREDR
jgi:hypothetical protein